MLGGGGDSEVVLGSADGLAAVGDHGFVMNLLSAPPGTVKNLKQFRVRGANTVQIHHKNKEVRSGRRRKGIVTTQSKTVPDADFWAYRTSGQRQALALCTGTGLLRTPPPPHTPGVGSAECYCYYVFVMGLKYQCYRNTGEQKGKSTPNSTHTVL